MIATPAFNGNLNIQYLFSFTSTVGLLNEASIKVVPVLSKSSSLLVAERNRLVEAFWKSDCTHVLFIDADLGWTAESVLSMLKYDKEFVAGIYPARTDENVFIYRPSLNKNGSVVQNDDIKHLLKMEYIPAGFMMLSRGAIAKMREKFPELYFRSKQNNGNKELDGYCLFNTEVWNGEFWGEDYVFCRKAREAGIDIWVDPTITFDHAGKIGALAETLTNENPNENNTISEAA